MQGTALSLFKDRSETGAIRLFALEFGYYPWINEIPCSCGETGVYLGLANSSLGETAEWLDLSGHRPDLVRTENLRETIAQATQFP